MLRQSNPDGRIHPSKLILMSLPFLQVALIGKYQSPGIRSVLERIGTFLTQRNIKVHLESAIAANTGLTGWGAYSMDDLGRSCELAIVAGGDGTMLSCARALAPHGVALLGVNLGRLGFMADTPMDRMNEVLGPVLEGTCEHESRAMLEGRVFRGARCIAAGIALNEVAIHRSSALGAVEVAISFDDAPIASVLADGLIVSSPTGSTAYGMAAGGPILHPAIDAWIVVAIAARTVVDRPLALPQCGPIELLMGRDSAVSFDGQLHTALQPGDRVRIVKAAHPARFVHPRGWRYFDTLREKLHWYGNGA